MINLDSDSIEVLKAAIKKYGHYTEIEIAIEEMSELTKALLKYRRAERAGQVYKEQLLFDIYEEIADVIITLNELILIYGGNDIILDNINWKIERLCERIKQ